MTKCLLQLSSKLFDGPVLRVLGLDGLQSSNRLSNRAERSEVICIPFELTRATSMLLCRLDESAGESATVQRYDTGCLYIDKSLNEIDDVVEAPYGFSQSVQEFSHRFRQTVGGPHRCFMQFVLRVVQEGIRIGRVVYREIDLELGFFSGQSQFGVQFKGFIY